MKRFYGFLFAVGLFSIPLKFAGISFQVLWWMDSWGDTIGMILRIILMVFGFLMWKNADV